MEAVFFLFIVRIMLAGGTVLRVDERLDAQWLWGGCIRKRENTKRSRWGRHRGTDTDGDDCILRRQCCLLAGKCHLAFCVLCTIAINS